ncbi:MAG: DUF2520 domain-containing protein [Deltaproteobacteria bacterium]|nr:DUF2520 domain-containing protein [Deltaproteobacteria bacterium]
MPKDELLRVCVVGRGRVGRGLIAGLARTHDAGLTVSLAGARRMPRRMDVDVVVLAVPDGTIEAVAQRVLERVDGAPVLLHCAGALGVDAYGALPREFPKVAFGAMHPLVSFADPKRPPPLAGTCFAVAGPKRARLAAARIAKACGATPMGRGTEGVHGAAYHAAAALVANGAAGLAFVGVGLLRELGLSKKASERALGSLLRTVAHNVETIGVPAALTGPVMRGDQATVTRHRRALRRGTDPRKAYDALVPVIERCAAALQRKRK